MITKRISKNLSDNVFVDIMEFKALQSGTIGFDMMNIQRSLDVEFSETDFGYFNDIDDIETEFIHKVDLIQSRMERVGICNYPFDISDDGSRLHLKSDISDSGFIYLFCLLLSHPKEDDVLSGEYKPNITDIERRLFQSCSTVAASGLIKGNSVSFGFPRPDNTGFLEKLKEVYALIGGSKIRDEPIAATPKNIKDFEIDVIAWLRRPDVNVLERYFLAQVASGFNWDEKALTSETIDKFHYLFFSEYPQSKFEKGMFIPFAPEHKNQIVLDDYIRILEGQYGKFHYRFSIPRHYNEGIKLSQQNNKLIIDGISDFHKIKTWVSTEIKRIKSISTGTNR